MFPFRGVDYLEIDSLFSEEEKLVRQTARQFVEDRVIPIIEKHNREATFPLHLAPEMAELEFFGANLRRLRLRRHKQRRVRPGSWSGAIAACAASARSRERW